jgi:hypothetical protein
MRRGRPNLSGSLRGRRPPQKNSLRVSRYLCEPVNRMFAGLRCCHQLFSDEAHLMAAACSVSAHIWSSTYSRRALNPVLISLMMSSGLSRELVTPPTAALRRCASERRQTTWRRRCAPSLHSAPSGRSSISFRRRRAALEKWPFATPFPGRQTGLQMINQ